MKKEQQQPTVGRIVHFYHNNNPSILETKFNGTNNNVEFCPAIITQTFPGTTNCNLTAFPPGAAPFSVWGIYPKEWLINTVDGHTNLIPEHTPFWRWPSVPEKKEASPESEDDKFIKTHHTIMGLFNGWTYNDAISVINAVTSSLRTNSSIKI